MPHAQSFITRALKSIGVVAAGETLEAEDLADGFADLNDMIDAWAIDRLIVYTTERVPLTWTGGASTRTIGVGGNFNRARPVFMNKASIVHEGHETPLYVTDDVAEWQRVPLKATQSSIPHLLYNDRANPLSNLYLYPVPSVSVNLILYCPLVLSQFTTPTTLYAFPPGYARAIRTNLAVELAPGYEIEPSQRLIKQAEDSKADIMIQNIIPEVVPVDTAITRGNRRTGGSGFDYRTGH